MAHAAAAKAQQTTAPARIVGRIHRSGGRGDVFLVESRSQPGRLYRVEVKPSRLVCPCDASRYIGRCAHRKAVHDALRAEAEAAAGETAAHSASPPVVAIALPGPPVVADAVKLPGAAAMVRRSNQPFSIWR